MKILLKNLKLMNKIQTSEPKILWKLKCKLGEGTLWVKEHNSIYFVDIKKKQICILNTNNNKKKIFKVNKEIGFLAHVRDNIFILGLQGELRIQNLKSKKITNLSLSLYLGSFKILFKTNFYRRLKFWGHKKELQEILNEA